MFPLVGTVDVKGPVDCSAMRLVLAVAAGTGRGTGDGA